MTIRSNPHVVAQDANDESVLLDTKTHRFFELNQAATLVWQSLGSGRSIDDAATEIASRFDIALETARADVVKLVDELCSLGLLSAERE